MTEQGPGNDIEPCYVHFVAPDPRRLEPLDNTVGLPFTQWIQTF